MTVNLIILGAVFVLGSVSGVGGGVFLATMFFERKNSSLSTASCFQPPEPDPESLRLARQYENIMNYDGTERGQMSLEK